MAPRVEEIGLLVRDAGHQRLVVAGVSNERLEAEHFAAQLLEFELEDLRDAFAVRLVVMKDIGFASAKLSIRPIAAALP